MNEASPRLKTETSHGVRRAVLLAAGTGTRLQPLTDGIPKCLLKVAGETIIERALRTLACQGIKEAVIVVGHCGEAVRSHLGSRFAGIGIEYADAPDYATTNNIRSLWDARGALDTDLLLVEGDLVFDADVIAALLATPGNSAAVVPVDQAPPGSKVCIDDANKITQFILDGANPGRGRVYKTANIYLMRKDLLVGHVVPRLSRAISGGHVNQYYESIFRDLVQDGSLTDFAAVDISAARWCEIDDLNDLDAADFLFLSRSEQFDRLQRLYGSYWRYGVADHSYISNVYFPTRDLFGDLEKALRSAVTSYPVGQSELARIAGKWTGANRHHLAVANGACELIKILAGAAMCRPTIPAPAFNEYESVIAASALNRFPLDPRSFELDVDAFAKSAIEWGSDMAVVASPNNPTGLSVRREQLLRLAEMLAGHRCRLMVDESFVEFSRAGRSQSVEDAVDRHPNLVVIKSMSKVFGIPGLRLGYLLSADRDLIRRVQDALPIWNVNGLAEEFLRIIGKYQDAFVRSCDLTRESCRELEDLLSALPQIQPLKSDANFILCRLAGGQADATDVARRLYIAHNILIKDCSGKTMPDAHRYLRIAARTRAENQRLVFALASVL